MDHRTRKLEAHGKKSAGQGMSRRLIVGLIAFHAVIAIGWAVQHAGT